MNKILMKILVTTIMSCLLVGCGMNVDVEDIMEAPKHTINSEKMTEIIQQYIGKDAKLQTPENLNSPMQYIDLDNDGKNETIVFYSNDSDQNIVLKTAVFDYDEENDFVIKKSVEGIGLKLQKVFFGDIDGNGTLEIIVGYMTEKNMPKVLAVYRYEEQRLEEIFIHPYTEILAYDLDGDSKTEIIITSKDENNMKSALEIYKYIDDTTKLVEKKSIDYGFVSNLKVGKINENKLGVFVDSVVGASAGTTNMFAYKDGMLIDPLGDSARKLYSTYSTTSEDVDEDGIIEVMKVKPLVGCSGLENAVMIFKTQWYKWDGSNGLEYVMDSVPNYEGEYELLFRNKLGENINVKREKTKDRITEIYELIEDEQEKEIFEIITVIGKENIKDLPVNYKYITTYKDMIYFIKVIDENLFETLKFQQVISNDFRIR